MSSAKMAAIWSGGDELIGRLGEVILVAEQPYQMFGKCA